MAYSIRYEQALAFAAWLHEKQIRKGSGVPYISHLLAVSGLVIENGGSEDEAIAALLHDAIEDQSQRFGGADNLRTILHDRFGEIVLRIVEGCTDADTAPKPPWRARKEAYIARLAHVDNSVLLVSACDKLHNARTLLTDLREWGDDLWVRFNGGKEGSLWYYRSMVETLRSAGAPFRIVNELDEIVQEIERTAT